MSSRSLLNSLLTALGVSPFRQVYMVELGFDSGQINLHSRKGTMTVNATELVANGTFDTDTTGWTGSNATLSVASGELVVTVAANGVSYAYQAITTVAGLTYNISVDYTADGVTGDSFAYVGTTAGASDLLSIAMASATGTYTGSFVATGATTYISLATSGSALAGETNNFDNVSVKHSIPNEGFVYSGAGILLAPPSVEETSQVIARGISMTLSGVPSSISALALSEPYQGRSCVVRYGSWDAPQDAAVLFDGEIDQMNPVDDARTSTITLKAENDLVLLDRTAERTYSDANQKQRFPSDDFFSHVTKIKSAKPFKGQ